MVAFEVLLTIGQGGIVFDSDPYDEWMETINKLGALISLFDTFTAWANDQLGLTASCVGANTHCITSAEEKHLAEQEDGEGDDNGHSHSTSLKGDAKTRISLVAG